MKTPSWIDLVIIGMLIAWIMLCVVMAGRSHEQVDYKSAPIQVSRMADPVYEATFLVDDPHNPVIVYGRQEKDGLITIAIYHGTESPHPSGHTDLEEDRTHTIS